MESVDNGRWYRHRHQRLAITSRSMPNNSHWVDAFGTLWNKIFDFRQKRHFSVQYNFRHSVGNKLWPGTKVLLTDSRLVSQAGVYGVVAFTGVVTDVTRVPKGKGAGDSAYSTARIFVHAENSTRVLYSPVARAKGYDSENNRILIYDDYLETGENDADLFSEPSWSSLGGDANISIYQWDRRSWTLRGHSIVSSVNAEVGDSYLQLDDALGFTYYRDQDTLIVFRSYSGQDAAWVLGLFSPTADEDGLVAGETDSKPFL